MSKLVVRGRVVLGLGVFVVIVVVLVGWLAGFFPVWNEEETSPSAKWLCEGKTVSGPVTDKCS